MRDPFARRTGRRGVTWCVPCAAPVPGRADQVDPHATRHLPQALPQLGARQRPRTGEVASGVLDRLTHVDDDLAGLQRATGLGEGHFDHGSGGHRQTSTGVRVASQALKPPRMSDTSVKPWLRR